MGLRKNKNHGSSTGGGNPSKALKQVKRVEGLILKDTDIGYTGPHSIGTIFFSDEKSGEIAQDPSSLPYAIPRNRNNVTYPVIGEFVIITQGPAPDYYPELGGSPLSKINYYSDPISVYGNGSNNAVPNQTNTEDHQLGTYFKENVNLSSLKPGEGDTIMEGKNGQRIRFTTTGPDGSNSISRNVTDDPNDGNPSIGQRAIIISLGSGKSENITADNASIYMFENHSIPLDAASTNVDSLNTTYTPIKDPLDTISDPPADTTPEPPPPPPELQVDDIDFTPDPEGNDTINETVTAPPPDTVIDDPLSDPVFDALDEAIDEGILTESSEDFIVGGTELGDEEAEELEEAEEAVNNNGGSPGSGEEYVPVAGGETLIIENPSQYRDWKKKGNGKADYPIIFKPVHGNTEVFLQPYSISSLITKLKNDNITAEGCSRNIRHMCLHVTATPYRNQHDLVQEFLYNKKWKKHGYHISIDEDGGCNYNVPINKVSYGCGGNVFENGGHSGIPKMNNTNSINISWIGTEKVGLTRPDLSPGTTTKLNMNAKQAYAYEKLVRYFSENFPDILIHGHNQITVNYGYGKSCPTFHTPTYLDLLGIPDKQINRKAIYDLDKQGIITYLNGSTRVGSIEAVKLQTGRYGDFTADNPKLFSNFKNAYYGKKHKNSAKYVYKLTHPNKPIT